MNINKNYWNKEFENRPDILPKYDLWLDKYSNILDHSKDTPIIDLGCGLGNNSLYLYERGFNIIACDISEVALERVQKHVPNINTKCFDLLEGIPLNSLSYKVIIADLCLHYFRWDDTIKIVNELGRVLINDGYLICRLNSTKDIYHGAGQGEIVEENFFANEGRTKRFFTREQIEILFKNWQILNINECQMDRYVNPKILWEVALKNCK